MSLRRGLPEDVRDLARLDPEAIERVREEARPAPRDAEELHDVLLGLVLLRPVAAWEAWFDALALARRAARVETSAGVLWFAVIGLSNGLAVIAMYAALNRGSVTLVSPLVATYPLITLLLSAALLRSVRVGLKLVLGVAGTVAGVGLLMAG